MQCSTEIKLFSAGEGEPILEVWNKEEVRVDSDT
jgi:hypothetical protein